MKQRCNKGKSRESVSVGRVFLFAYLLAVCLCQSPTQVGAEDGTNDSSPPTEVVIPSHSEEVTSPESEIEVEHSAGQAQPVAVSEMSETEKQRAIAQMGANQGDVWVWSSENQVEGEKRGPNGGPGQFNAGAVVLGGRPTYDPPASWYYLAYKGDGMTDEEAQAIFEKERGKWMNEFDPWGVVLEMSDNQASKTWVDVRNMTAFVLREGQDSWEKIVDHPDAVQWVSQFKGNMATDTGEGNKLPISGGGTSLEVLPKQDRVAHWGSNQNRSIAQPETIRGVLVSVEARISDLSDPNAKLGIQVGGDWKFTNEEIHPYWYPGAGLAGIQRLSNQWERYYFVSILGVQDAVPERGISIERFLSTHVPLADMPSESVPTPLPPMDTPPNHQESKQDGESTIGESPQPSLSVGSPSLSAQSNKVLPKTGSGTSVLLTSIGGLLLLGIGWLGRKKKSITNG